MNQEELLNQEKEISYSVTEKQYPIAVLWIFKAPIIIFVVSVAAFVFGFWFPHLVIAFPILLIVNPLTRANFQPKIWIKPFLGYNIEI